MVFLSYLILAVGTPALMHNFYDAEGMSGRINLLGYFTILSNIFLQIFMVLTLMGIPMPQEVKVALGAAILVTALVFQFLLKRSMEAEGLTRVASEINHGVTALLYLIWYVLQRDTPLPVKMIWAVIPYPLIYCVLSTIEGVKRGEFRYFFMDIIQLGLKRYLFWLSAIITVFIASGFLFITLSWI